MKDHLKMTREAMEIYIGKKVKVHGVEGTLEKFRARIQSCEDFFFGSPKVEVLLNDGRMVHRVAIRSLDDIKIIQEKESTNKVDSARIDHLMETATFDVRTVHGKCTIVVAKLENGFILTESSACVDQSNYELALGEEICKDKIRERLWELEGYALQKSLYEREG